MSEDAPPPVRNYEPVLKPDGRIRRVAELTERKLQLEVELLELKVAQARKDLENAVRIPCGDRLQTPGQEDCVCVLPAGHAEGYHLCKEGVGWN